MGWLGRMGRGFWMGESMGELASLRGSDLEWDGRDQCRNKAFYEKMIPGSGRSSIRLGIFLRVNILLSLRMKGWNGNKSK